MRYKQQIAEILVKHDIEGFIRMGAPIDEYDSEAEILSNRLVFGACTDNNPSVIATMLAFIFAASFGYDTPLSTTVYMGAASDIHKAIYG